MQFEPRYKTLVDIFDQSTRAYAGRDLFGVKKDGRWVWVTYAEFGALVQSFRGRLKSLGVERGDRIAIVSNNRVEWATAAYACYGLGATLVPMYEAQPSKDWEFIVRDCEAKVLIAANEAVLAKARPLFDAVPTLQKMVLLEGNPYGDQRVIPYSAVLSDEGPPPARSEPDDVATILYTSGTTGVPKGVVLSHANLASNVSASLEIFPIRPGDVSLSILPWAHAFGQTAELHVFFAAGGAIAICEGIDKILSNLAEVRPTILACVPAIFNRVYTAAQQQLASRPRIVQELVQRALEVKAKERAGVPPRLLDRAFLSLVDKIVFEKVRARLGGRLRFAISGGAALSREVAAFIDSIGILVFEGYGLTETSPTATANSPGARKIGSVGRPLPGVRIEIDPAAAERNQTEEGNGLMPVEGEIVVYGPNVMKGYFRRPEDTATVFTPGGGFRTGDMGYVDADGYLFISGRIKEQYKLENGKYVVPSPLEDQLKLSPYIANVMVYGENKPHNVALVVANVPALRNWAASNHLALPERDDELLKHDRVRALLSSEIATHSANFKRFERIKDFVVSSDVFNVESGLLTPKMSLKRRKVLERYGPLIEQLYATGKSDRDRASAPA